MNNIEKYILGVYNDLPEGESQQISEESVRSAIRYVEDFELNNSESLFLILAALNLLNADVKNNNKNTSLYYSFIKSNVSKVAEFVIANKPVFNDVLVYYDKNQKCLFFSVFNVVFSFHQVKETKNIVDVAAKSEPIIWAGIRLQRIAQSVYTYAKEVYDKFSNKDNLSGQKSLIGNMEPKSLLYAKSNLYPCPDCQHLISPSATICPNCGGIIAENTIIKGYCVGDIVQITHSIYKVLGEIASINPHFISIYRRNDAEVKIRINAIDSIQSIDKSNNTQTISFEEETNGVLSPQKIVNVLDDVISKMFSILSIDNKTLIPTNSTVTGIDENGIEVLSDKGEAVRLFTHMINYRKKNCQIGARLYINNIEGFYCPFSIKETTFHDLLLLLRKAILYRKGLTPKRKKEIISILKFMMEEMTSQREAYVEFDSFYKIIIQHIGTAPILDDGDSITDTVENIKDIEKANKTSATLYKTETEQLLSSSGFPQPMVLGKIELNTITGKKKNSRENVSIERGVLEKPSILSAEDTLNFLNSRLTNLPENQCKRLEKELDALIRNGEKEECLARSYQIITTKRPTPKYLRSYLDRIVNTEIALDHTEQALKALAYLIAFNEKQEDSNINTLGHLYITMARLYLKEENKDEALKAVIYAEKLRPDNNAIKKLKDSIMSLGGNENENNLEGTNALADPVLHEIVDDSISKMLLQDVEQEAHRQELLPSSEIVPAEQLFGNAQNNRNSLSDTYDDKAYSFLEAAAAYYNNKQTDAVMFKISVANYARFKGHGMFTRFSNLQKSNNTNLVELQALRDSASSYYIEALVIFNALGEKEYLQELFLKYLQMAIVVSNIEGGKTPADEWENWTLKQLQLDCLKADSIEEKKVLFNACIAIGTAAEGAWNTLYSDEDGLNPFISRFRNQPFRDESYRLLNELAGASVSSDFQPGAFMHRIFEHRQLSINELHDYLKDCFNWPFSTYAMSTFEPIWNKVVGYKDLMTTTDKKVMSSINDVIEILKPYASRINGDERTRSLASSQQLLYNAQKIVSDTTTFYGKTFYSHLIANWLDVISRQLDERNISSYPKLEISPEPCYIKTDDDGLGFISFVVSNTGDSTAQSYIVEVNVEGKIISVSHDSELTSGDCSAELVKTDLLSNIEHTYGDF